VDKGILGSDVHDDLDGLNMSTSSRFSVHRKIETSPEVAVHGQVATKEHVVDLILDLVGYCPDQPLSSFRLLDPGCGEGAFVVEAARRLIGTASCLADVDSLASCLLGIEKDQEAVEVCRSRVSQVLIESGVQRLSACRIARKWIVCEDFLRLPLTQRFRFVVGNPPYVRQEAIPKDDLLHYRQTFKCFYDRADLYVAFFEKSLHLLDSQGVLGFICPDRFTRNNYGRKLRRMITSEYSVKSVLDLTQASPFSPEVTCYPGIFIIGKESHHGVDYFRLTQAAPSECKIVQEASLDQRKVERPESAVVYHHYEKWFSGEQQWTTESPAHLAILRRLEKDNVPLDTVASGCRVGIGVATGADKVFIVRPGEIDIEPELLMPLAMTDDIASGEVNWTGRCVINPFKSVGLIDLAKYPKARRYFEKHEGALKARNVANRTESSRRTSWYRTIDRIYPALQRTPKLLIPDIKADNLIVLERGKLYPHHNLYYVASEAWDLAALRTILRSSVARFFVWMYGVKMRGNFLRFQAQYLRCICIPLRIKIGAAMIAELSGVPATATTDEVDRVVSRLYKLSDDELELIRDIASG